MRILLALLLSGSLALGAPPRVLLRCDDLGFCHSVDVAAQDLMDQGLVFSASVLVPCPWFLEAAGVLKAHPAISAGVHLCLTSEWRDYRWEPVLGRDAVPSLVDRDGYFPSSEDAFKAGHPRMEEVERELTAQIRRARQAGLKLDYVDCHMGIVSSTPELRAVLEKVAKAEGLGISTWFGERERSLWDVAPGRKRSQLLAWLKDLEPEKVNLFVFHLGLDNDEMRALYDLNNLEAPGRIGRHRGAEYHALRSRQVRKALGAARIITYRELAEEPGPGAMKAPAFE